MFSSARLKLTLWYLLIITVISFVFSLVIYQLISTEINRFATAQRVRFERHVNSSSDKFFLPPPPTVDAELVEESRHRLLLNLIVVNLSIISLSGALSFFLAGKTLDPIATMIEDQNRFISDSSHELRTPITAMKSALEVNLRDPKLTIKDAKELINDNLEEVNHLQSLSDGLLRLAQVQKPNQKVSFSQYSLKDIAERAVSRLKPLAKTKSITIVNQIQDVKLTCDQTSIVDLLAILVDNAIKYSPEKQKIVLSSSLQKGRVAFSVKDNGIGIDSKDIPHIFDRFYRADQARSKNDIGGYGLGLSIAKKIVDQHSGEIKVDSLPGKGTTFTVSFQA